MTDHQIPGEVSVNNENKEKISFLTERDAEGKDQSLMRQENEGEVDNNHQQFMHEYPEMALEGGELGNTDNNNKESTKRTSWMIRGAVILLVVISAISLTVILVNRTDDSVDKPVSEVSTLINNSTNSDRTNPDDEAIPTDNNNTFGNNTTVPEVSSHSSSTTTPDDPNPDNTTDESVSTQVIESNEESCIRGSSMSISSDGELIVYSESDTTSNSSNLGVIRIKLFDLSKNESSIITTINNSAFIEHFGMSVSFSRNGNAIAYSFYGDVSTSVRVLLINNNEWNQVGNDIQYLKRIGAITLSLSDEGDYLALGYSEDHTEGMNSGKTSIYTHNITIDEWQLVSLTASNNTDGEMYGKQGVKSGTSVSVSTSKNGLLTFAYGAPKTSYEADITGAFYVHRYNTSDATSDNNEILLNEYAYYGPGYNSEFGGSISLSKTGNRIAAGAHLYSLDKNKVHYGLCNIYQYNETMQKYIPVGNSILGVHDSSILGEKVVLSGDGQRVAITSRINALEYPTIIQVYEYSGDTWGVVGNHDFHYNTSINVGYGSSISFNFDGSLLAVASDGIDINIDNSEKKKQCGQIFIYDVMSTQTSKS